ncbi:MAG: lytic murein transglycosylase B [Gammaproteobacteria bacterium]|nr:lytic murein transglycosylase B [Gammaproteobacteria bacterium]
MKLTQIISLNLLLAFSLLASTASAEGFTDKKEVKIFIQQMVKKHQFNKSYLETLFAEAKLYDSILEAIARPAEGKPWYEYRPIFVTKKRTQGGINFWKENADALARAEQKYGVPREIIVAIIGVETRYGKHAGKYPVFDALATLAFGYPPRATFFKSELEHFLLMTREEKIQAKDLLGSYAGAMGMPQFISSSFRHYAVDFDGDGKRDLWNNTTDAIGSVANYFRKHHWKPGQPITHQVQVHGVRHKNLITNSLKPSHTQLDLLVNGVILPGNIAEDLKGKLLKLKKPDNPEYWVAWDNFYVITRYNHSALYSMAVYQLSQKIKQGYLNE